MACNTRSRAEDWLTGKRTENLPSNRLPTKGDVLKFFFHLKESPLKDNKFVDSIDCVAEVVVSELEIRWRKSGIPFQRKDQIKKKVLRLYHAYRNLQKRKGKTSNEGKESCFVKDLDAYFDISQVDAEQKIQADRLRSAAIKVEDIVFLKAIKENNLKVSLGSEDKVYTKKVESKIARENQLRKRKGVEKERVSKELSNTGSTDANDDGDDEDGGDEEFPQPSLKEKAVETVTLNLPRNPFKSPKICQMADRLGLSAGESTAFMAAVVSEGGADLVKEVFLSKTTVRTARKTVRQKTAEGLKSTFEPPEYAVLHWDGKITSDGERLAVLISGPTDHQEGKLLGIPVIPNGTGTAQANATFQLAHEWNVANNIIGLSFDTTGANSGRMNGACVKVEDLLQKKLFHLACRHHILERVLCAAWKSLFGQTTSPQNSEFKELQMNWGRIRNREDFKTLNIRERTLRKRREHVLNFLRETLAKKNTSTMPRDDYRESAELMVILLGEIPPRGIHWMKPGACHHARWMSTILYAAKLFAFSHQLGLDTEKIDKLERICKFNALFYVKAWLSAPIAADTPINDLQLWHDLKAYAKLDPDVAEPALKTLEGHFWYLTEEITPFALFSEKLPESERRQIARQVLKYRRDANAPLPKGQPVFPTLSASTKLPSLVGPKSWFLFQALGLNAEWLSENPQQWKEHPDFQKAKQFVRHVKVVNDLSERAVKLVQDFSSTITNDEQQRQFLLQLVERHRKSVPNFRKKTLQNIKKF